MRLESGNLQCWSQYDCRAEHEVKRVRHESPSFLCPLSCGIKNEKYPISKAKEKTKAKSTSNWVVAAATCSLAKECVTLHHHPAPPMNPPPSAFWPLAKLLQEIYANIWFWQSADFMGGSRVAQLRSFVLPGHGCVCEPTLCLSLVNGAKGL